MRPMAIAGHEVARFNLLEVIEVDSGNVARGMKHLTIAATAGLLKYFERVLLVETQSSQLWQHTIILV